VKDEKPALDQAGGMRAFGQARNTRIAGQGVPSREESSLTPKGALSARRNNFLAHDHNPRCSLPGIRNVMGAMKITHQGTLGPGELFSVTIENDLRGPRSEAPGLQRNLMLARRMFSPLAHLQNRVADKSGMTFCQIRTSYLSSMMTARC
jgi:hypothetical protein